MLKFCAALMAAGAVLAYLLAGTIMGNAPLVGDWFGDSALPWTEARGGELWAWAQANRNTLSIAAGTLFVTALYHRLNGRTTRQALEAAITRTTVVVQQAPPAPEPEVVTRARNRATLAQLRADHESQAARLERLPREIASCERDVCYTENALTEARRALANKEAVHRDTTARLERLRAELERGKLELAALRKSLDDLQEQV